MAAMAANPQVWMLVGSTIFNALGSRQEGKAAEDAARFRAAQLDQQAGQARASSQRRAAEERRQAALAQSRLRALAGGGGGDPTIVHLSQDIAGEGEYRALSALYEGEESARGMETGASAARYEAAQARSAGGLKAAGTIFGGAMSLMDKYGKGR